jgi:hypothetical protein
MGAVVEESGRRPRRGISIDAGDGAAVLEPGRILVRHTHVGYVCAGIGQGARLLRFALEDGADGAAFAHGTADLGGLRDGLDDLPLRRLAAAAALTKAGFDPSEPRDERGRWTDGGQGEVAAAAAAGLSVAESVDAPSLFGRIGPEVVAGLAELAAGMPAATAFLGVLLLPTNRSLISEGSLPDHPDIAYRYDRGTGVFSLVQGDGEDKQLLFEGRAGTDGLYRDADGHVIARHVGDSVIVDPDALPGYIARAKSGESSNVGANAQALAEASDNKVRLCPDATPESIAGRKPPALAYQKQITGLSPGLSVKLNGVDFDGCDVKTGTMLEAKGPGYAKHMINPTEWKEWYGGAKDMEKQMERQHDAAAGRLVEWHFAEEPAANYFREYAKKYANVIVLYTPPVSQ